MTRHKDSAAAQTRGNKRFRRSLEKYYQAANFRLEGFEPRIMLTVSDLAASVVSSSRVDLSWRDQDSNESAFVIEQSQDGGSSWQSLGETYPNQTSYSLTGLQAAWDYDYRVRARYADNTYSAYSNQIAVTTLGFAAPAGLSAKVVSGERVDLSWQDRTLDESYFDIERSTDGGTTWQLYTQVYPNQTSYSISGLDPGASYSFRVRGEQSGGNFSDYSNSIAVTTTPFAAPSELAATAISGSQIDLSWHDNTDNEAAFVIERSLDGGTTWQAYSEVYPSQTSYRMESLDPGTTYSFRVRARHTNGSYSGFSQVATTTTLPFSGPTDLAATVVSGSQIDLAWKDHSDNEDSFYIEQSDDGGTSWQSLGSVYANQTSYQVTGLEPGTSYSFRVRAHHPNLTFSEYTNVVTSSTANFAAPSSLTYNVLSGERVDLAWQDNSDNESAFVVERSDDAGASWVPYAELYPNQTSFQMTGLTPGASYLFRVRGKHGNGSYSAYTNTVSATTNVVGAPSNLTATAVSGSRIDLAWQDHSDNEDGFYIERSDDGGSTWQSPIVLYANQTSYQVTDVTSGNTYSFRVRARHVTGVYSAYSNTATTVAQGLGAPSDLNLSSVSATEINLFWRDNSPAESGFKVERKANDEQSFTEIAQLPANSTAYSATGLNPAKTYSFRVRSYDATQNSPYSNTATLTTSPVTAPSSLSATVVSGSSIKLDWSDNSDNENTFYIERSLNGGGTWEAYTNVSPDETNYLVTGLDPGTTYQFRVRGGHSNGSFSTYSNTVSATTTAFAAPSLLTATAISGTEIKLNWTDNSDNEASFLIETSSDAGVTWEPYTSVSADQTNYLVTGLQPGVSYQFKVSGHHGNGSYSSSSNVAIATTTAFSGAAELKATVMSGSRIDLSWTDLADGESAFYIEESIDGGANWTAYTSLGADQTSYSVTGLDPGATYSFRVRAQHSGGTFSPYSNVATAQTVPFAAPGALRAAVISGSRVDLAWQDLSDNEASFWIEESTDSGATWAALTSVMANQTSYSVTGLDPGHDYSFRVRGQLSNGSYSAYSTPVSVNTTTFAAPTRLTAQVLSSHEINLQWQDQSDNESAFWIESSVNGGGTWAALTNTSANQTSYLVTSLDPGVTYSFRVRGQLSSGAYSGYSNIVVAKTVTFAGPSNLQAVRISDTEIDLSWQDNTDDESSFDIERSSDGGQTWELYTDVSANQTSYAATGLPSGVNYDFRVRAQYANGTYSPYATTRTVAPQLNAPSDLSATPSGWLTRVTWRDNSSSETGFKVERRLGTNGPWTEIASVGVGVTEFLDAVTGGSYSYRVRAFYGTYLFSAYSNVSATISVGTPQPYIVPGTPGTMALVHIHFEKEKIEALYKNELGLFIVDGTDGSINGLLPADAGYAIAALTDGSQRIIFDPLANEGATFDIKLAAGTYLSYYLVQDNTTLSFVRNNPSNSMSGHPHVFFPNIDANKDGRYAHFVRTELPDGGVRYNVEDLDYGGDKDFDDMVFTVDATPEVPAATIELSVGSPLVFLNENHDELNADATGGPLEDNQVDAVDGDRIVAQDPDLQNASLQLDGTEGRWTLSFPTKIKVWRDSNGAWSQVVSGQQSEIVSGAQTMNFKVEGISISSSVNDVQLSASFTPTSGPTTSTSVTLTVLAVDAHVDSDNTNGFNQPDKSAIESLNETDPNAAGKIVLVNGLDKDNDEIPDDLDGYNRDGIAGNADDAAPATQFVPLLVDFEMPFDPSQSMIRFNYSGSDPAAATSGLAAPGKLRIWTKDGDQSRVQSNFIQPSVSYQASTLGFSTSNPSVTFWIEGIDTTQALDDRLIQIDVDPDGSGPAAFDLGDSVYVTTQEEVPTTGRIRGTVFHDRNRNSIWDGRLISGSRPDVVFVIDVSGSTKDPFKGRPVGDVNGDGRVNTILDGELAGFIALNKELMDPVYGEKTHVSIVTFDQSAYREDLNPAPEDQELIAATPIADTDGNGIPDVEDVLRDVLPKDMTAFSPALKEAFNIFSERKTPRGAANVVFLSDGFPTVDTDGAIVAAAKALRDTFDANMRAFGVGTDADLAHLMLIDDRAAIVTTNEELQGAFGSLAGDESLEEGLSGWQVYVDLNNNGQFDDPSEPDALTGSHGEYSISGLNPGTYTVRLAATDWSQTAPVTAPSYSVVVEAGKAVDGQDFGVIESGPQFTLGDLIVSGSMNERSPVTIRVPIPTGYGPFRYSFDLNGDGDFDDPDDIYRSVVNVASFTPDDNGPHVVKVRVDDAIGQVVYKDPITLNIANVAPNVAIDGDLASFVDLTGATVRSLSLLPVVRDPSVADTNFGFTYHWTVTRNGALLTEVTEVTDVNNPIPTPLTLALDPADPNALGSYVIELTATDKDLDSAQAQHTFTVGKGLPQITEGPIATQGETVTGTTADMTLTADDDGGAANLTYTWSATGPGPVSFSPSGAPDAQATFTRAGIYDITVLIEDADGNVARSRSYQVTVESIFSGLSPADSSITSNGTQVLQVIDQFGNSFAPSEPISWELVNTPNFGTLTLGSTIGSVVYHPGATSGQDTVRATIGTTSFTADVSVDGNPDQTGPTQPQGLSVASYPQALQLTWDDRPETDLDWAGWFVERSVDLGASWQLLNVNAIMSELGFDDYTAPVGAVSWYRIYAVDELGNKSAYSEIAKHRRSISAEPPPPSSLVGRSDGAAAIFLDWDDVTTIRHLGHTDDDLAGYNVYRKLPSDTDWGNPINAVLVTASEYRDATGLTASTQYEYRVTTVDKDDDESNPSATASAATGDGFAPAAPQSFTATALSSTSIQLQWVLGSGGTAATKFLVYRSTQTGRGFALVSLLNDSAARSFTDENLASNTSYYYRIYAGDADGDISPPSTEQTARTDNVSDERPFIAITNLDASDAPHVIQSDLEVRGIVDDANNDLEQWELVLRPLSSTASAQPIIIAEGGPGDERGQKPSSDVVLGTLRATMLQNGLYELVLRAKDAAEWQEVGGRLIQVKTDVKLGNFTLPSDDLRINVPNSAPILVRRVYDSSRIQEPGDFGPGWHLELSGTNLRTTAREGRYGSAAKPALRNGDLIYVDIPGMGSQTFQFLPTPQNFDRSNPGQSLVLGVVTYYARFVAIDGSGTKLTVQGDINEDPQDRLSLTRDGDEFYVETDGGQTGYNPSRSEFGGQYHVTTAEGNQFTIDAKNGELLNSTSLDGIQTSYANGQPTVAQKSVHIERYGDGRIDWIAAVPDAQQPDVYGPKVFYHYDETTNDLIDFVNEVGDTTTYTYDSQSPHYLVSVKDGRGVEVIKAAYDRQSGQLKSVSDASGNTAPLSYGGFDGTQGSASVSDPHGNATEQIVDSHGNVVRQIRAIMADGQVTKYLVTVHEYTYLGINAVNDYYDALEYGVSGQNQLVSTRDFLPFEVAANDSKSRYTKSPDPATLVREVTYNHIDPNNMAAPVSGLGLPATETIFAADGSPRTTSFLGYKFGRPEEIVDPYGNITWMTYDDLGRPVLAINPLGEGTKTVYGDSNPDGRTVDTYKVKDEDNDPTTRPDPLNMGVRISGEQFDPITDQLVRVWDQNFILTRYTYWPDGSVKEVTTQGPELSDREVVQSYSEYDLKGRVVKSADVYGVFAQNFYDHAGNLLVSVDRFGGQTVYSYDSRNNLIRTLYPNGTETRSTFDDMGHVEWSTDPFVSSSTYTFDEKSGVVTWTAQDNTSTAAITRSIYDSSGRLTGTQRYRAARLQLSTDSAGEGVFSTSLPADSGSWVNISSTATVYDSMGKVIESTNAAGLRAGNIYYANGQLHHTGRIVTTSPSERHLTFNESTNEYLVEYTSYDYDQVDGQGHYDAITDALGNTTKSYKDALGRVTKVVYADGSFTETLYARTSETVTGVDLPTAAEGWVFGEGYRHVVEIAQRKTGEPQVATHYLYDPSDRLVEVWLPAVDNADTPEPDPVRPHWHYEYNVAGNQTLQRDPNGHETIFTYDELGRRVSRILPSLQAEYWGYDEFGRVDLHRDFKGQTTTYIYDTDQSHAGRLKEEHRFIWTADETPDEVTQYGYDSFGRQNTVTEYAQLDGDPELEVSRATTTTDYDDITGGITRVSSPEGVINHEYDPATGQLTRTYTANNDTTYIYDSRGRLWKMRVTKLNGQTVDQLTSYTYDAVGDLDTVTNDNGTPADTSDDLVHDYDYDTLNRLDVLTVRRGSNNLFTQDYQLESDGQRDYVVERRYTSPTQFSETKIDWGYDALGRLTSEIRDEGNDDQNGDHDYTMTFAYDLAGNRKTQVIHKPGQPEDETVSYTYDEGDRLLFENSTIDANGASYGYDLNGSMIEQTKGSVHTTYGWDLRNRMTSVTSPNASTTYRYDEQGQRVSEQTGSYPSVYYLNDWENPSGYPQVLEETTGQTSATATLTRSYILGLRVEGQADSTGAVQFILDGHGSNRGLLRSDGKVIERYDYQAFGQSARFEGIDPVTGAVTALAAQDVRTMHLFGGDSEYDSASGFSYHDARWRDDFRFLSFDSFEADPASPASLHKYAYSNANPVNYIDATGHNTSSEILMGTTIIAVVNGLLGAALGGTRHGWRGALGGLVGGIDSTYISVYATLYTTNPMVGFGLGALVGTTSELLITDGFEAFKTWRPYFTIIIATGVGALIGAVAGAGTVEIAEKLGEKILDRVGAQAIVEAAFKETAQISEMHLKKMVDYAIKHPAALIRAFNQAISKQFSEAAVDSLKAFILQGGVPAVSDALLDGFLELVKPMAEFFKVLRDAVNSRI